MRKIFRLTEGDLRTMIKSSINKIINESYNNINWNTVDTIEFRCYYDEDEVNYSHLKEGASCFIETTCIKVSLNVEDVSPQALISVVPTVLCITL